MLRSVCGGSLATDELPQQLVKAAPVRDHPAGDGAGLAEPANAQGRRADLPQGRRLMARASGSRLRPGWTASKAGTAWLACEKPVMINVGGHLKLLLQPETARNVDHGEASPAGSAWTGRRPGTAAAPGPQRAGPVRRSGGGMTGPLTVDWDALRALAVEAAGGGVLPVLATAGGRGGAGRRRPDRSPAATSRTPPTGWVCARNARWSGSCG